MAGTPDPPAGAGAARPGRRGPTFRLRLTLAMFLLALAVLTAVGVTIFAAARHILRRNLDNALLAIARTEVASSLDAPGGRVHVHEEGWAPIEIDASDGYVKLAMVKRAGTVLAQTANLASGPALDTDPVKEAHALAGEPSFGSLHRGEETYRGIYYPLRDATGEPLVAVVALPLAPIKHSLDTLLGVLVGVLVVGSGAAAWGASLVAPRLTRPLERIAEAARAIDASDLAARIPATSPDAELREVTAILNQMLGRLQAAIESQRRFVADASHELRSPLGNLRGTVEVALRRPRSGDEYAATLGEAQAEIERLCRLVDHLLTLSRADAGQIFLQRGPCDLAQLAEAAARAHAARAAAAGVTLACDAAQPVPVDGDADRLRAVLDNLVDNALRHAPRGSAVTVRANRADGRGTVAVRDAGAGLAPEEQAKVFERFYRTDAARARHSGGLGLGLAIARSVVEAHDGAIHVESAPGHGATFTIELPLAPPAGSPG
ncbi:MAG: ATP-binding protein [Deltaproteobacteria bacterium]|nr:ATP-binding protein [Deltaproteobacteria bacterium]